MKRLERRLFRPFLVLFGAMISALAYAAYQALTGDALLQAQVLRVQHASEFVVRLNELRADTQITVLRGLAQPGTPIDGELGGIVKEATRVVAELGKLEVSPTAMRLYRQFLAARERDAQARAQLIAAARAGDTVVAQLAYRRWDVARRRGDAMLADVSAYHLRELQRTLQEAEGRRIRSVSLLGLTIAISFFAVLAYASIVQRTVVRPITSLTEAAAGLPDALFDAPEAVGRDDEIGVLARTLQRVVAEMQVANEKLRDADHRKDEFLAILSHELRNPLAPIRYALPILEAQHLDAEGARAVAVTQRQIQHLARLVDDLLDVSRIVNDKIELRYEHVTLASVVNAAVEAVSPKVVGAGQTLSVHVGEEPVWLRGDPHRLAQILTNLLDNSTKYTAAGGELVLDAVRSGDEAVIRVRDNGIGIPAESLPSLFDMFRQVNGPGQMGGGLGIGLALVKRLVEMHGGAIVAHSGGLGAGAEFVVRLPVSPRLVAAPAAELPVIRRSARVLVVDDNVDLVEMLAFVVETAGHTVRTAVDGPSAIATALSYRPHVVLLDIGLPGMSGLEVARELRRRPELTGVKLVAMTGWGQPEHRQQTHDAGFDCHLTKPTDPDQLERLLAELAPDA